jgi:hypothetical protein
MQGNRPRACRLGAVGVGAEQKQRTGDAIRHGGLAGSYASVPAVSQRHTRVSSGGLACEQENPEVRKGVSIANQSGSIILSHGPQHPATTIPCRSSEQDHNTSRKLVNPLIELLRSLYAETSSPWQSQLLSPRATVRSTPDHLPPTATLPGKLLRHPRNLVTVEHFLSLILFATGVHFPSVLLYNQGYPKVCPDSLNLPNTGDPFCWNIVVIFLFSVFPNQGLNCFKLESLRVFLVKFPKPSLFQISELLHFIGIRKKFIKIQNQFCLNP